MNGNFQNQQGGFGNPADQGQGMPQQQGGGGSPWNLDGLLNEANKQLEEADKGRDYEGYRYLYPQDGTVVGRVLYNPSSGLVLRIIRRHNIFGNDIPCMEMYGEECQICKTRANIESSTGASLWRIGAQNRGLMFFTYVTSDYTGWNKVKEPSVGESVIFVVPQSICTDINRILTEAGSKAEQVVAANTGFLIKIARFKEGQQTKYRADLDRFSEPYRVCNTDDEFVNMLNNMPTLLEAKFPSQPTDQIRKQVREAAERIEQEMASGNIPQGGSFQSGGAYGQPPQGQGQMPPQPPQGFPGQQYPQAPPSGGMPPQQGQQYQAPVPPQGQAPPPPPQPPQGQGQAPVPPQPPQGQGQMPPQPPQGQGQGSSIPEGQRYACFGRQNDPNQNPHNCLACDQQIYCADASS